jgi:hypothetical protein
MTDSETAAALTRLIAARDTALHSGEDSADAGPFAQEIIAVMRGFGWRPTAARTFTAPVPSPAGTRSSRREELLAPVRAQLDELNAAAKQTREGAA